MTFPRGEIPHDPERKRSVSEQSPVYDEGLRDTVFRPQRQGTASARATAGESAGSSVSSAPPSSV